MRTTGQKIALFKSLFSGRTDVYGSYDPATGRAFQVKAPVTLHVLLAHLRGERPYGVYLLSGDRTPAVVVDFDDLNHDPVLRFTSRAAAIGVPVHVERSKSKGYHAWVFFQSSVSAAKGRRLVRGMLHREKDRMPEVFPKQDALGPDARYGNFINAPLFGRLVPAGRTVFVDPDRDMQPFPNQWDFLAGVKGVDEERLDTILRQVGADATDKRAPTSEPRAHSDGHPRRFMPRSSLPICARRMLNEGVTGNQRVLCFRLAVHFNRLGIPFDITVAALKEWARKNHPGDGKRRITDREIRDQADSAYRKAYRGCGCSEAAVIPFCDRECPLAGRVDGRN